MCSISKFDSYKRGTQIYDDTVGYSETMHEVLGELDCFCCVVFYEWLVLDPLGEFVNCNEDVLKTSFGLFEWTYLVQPLACERPGMRDANQLMSWYVSLPREHLASFALSD
jgi:hypothetical protein